MNIQIKLNCAANSKDFPKCLGAVLAATKLYKDYCRAIRDLKRIGPEGFAEEWMRICIQGEDLIFRDKVLSYFLQILKSVKNGS